MTDHGGGDVEAVPACDTGPESQFGVIGVCKKILVKTSDPVEHLAAIHRRASIGPQNLFDAVILTMVDLARSSSPILTVEVDEVAGLVNTPGILINQDLGRRHPDVRPIYKSGSQRFEPSRFRLRVIIQQRDKFALRGREPLVVCRAKSNVARVTNQLYPDFGVTRELLQDHLGRTIIRSIIYHDDI
jgi:hypothetical protein